MNGTVLQLTLRQLQHIAARPRLWIIFGVVVALFTVTGPFGTYDRLPFATRLGYWLSNHAMSWGSALFLVNFFNFALKNHIAHALVRMMIGAGVAALPIGAVVLGLNHTIMNVPVHMEKYVENVTTALPVSLALCLIVWLTMNSDEETATSANSFIHPAARADNQPSIAPRPALLARPALLDRLPTDKRGPIIRLEVQDHYVLVVTTRGREMVLMRLTDAMREVNPLEGCQVHRSHWVAREGIVKVLRGSGKNGRTTITTIDNVEIPVSRDKTAQLKAWLT